MEKMKMEAETTFETTSAANFCNTENQNQPAMSDNRNNSAAMPIHENQNSTALVLQKCSNNYASEIDAYLESFPPGFRFKPTDEELIVEYLMRKIQNKPPHPSRIHDVDIYRESPFYLSAKYAAANDSEWYFLSPRQKKYGMGKRPNRMAGNGYWKATGADKPIPSSQGGVGVVKTLVYFQGTHKISFKTEWIMKEYRANEFPASTLQEKLVNSTGKIRSASAKSSNKCMKLDDYVLYKIYKNKSNRSKNATFDGEANNLEEDEANDLEEGEANANDQYQEPFENFHDGGAQQENIYQDHGVDEYLVSGEGHFDQVTHVDNTHEIDYSANQQQQQLWPVPYPNYLGYNSYMIPNHVSMVIPQMHGNGFYDRNRELMLHETLYNQQHMARDYIPPETMLSVDASNNVLALNNVLNIPEEFCAAMSQVDASNNVQALPNISTEFSAAMSPLDASNNVQALSNVSKEFCAAMSPVDASNNVQPLSNISQEFSAAMPPVDAHDIVRVVKNEMNIPQMQEGQYQHRPVMTRPSTSSTYHPYHHPDHPNN